MPNSIGLTGTVASVIRPMTDTVPPMRALRIDSTSVVACPTASITQSATASGGEFRDLRRRGSDGGIEYLGAEHLSTLTSIRPVSIAMTSRRVISERIRRDTPSSRP